jgi:3-hydroxy acid dehydrogenase/malonic semialdehyde reductase
MPHLKRTALITGASSGIGAAIATALLREHWRVVGIARNFSKFAPDGDFHPESLDLADLDDLPERLSVLSARHPAVDAVILGAGQGRFGSLEEFSYAQIRALTDLNFTSQAYVVRAFLPLLKRRGGGNLVFIGSEAALRGSRKGSVYCAGKFALRGFAQALREECGKSGVRVAVINPGMVKTPFFDGLDFEPGADESHYLTPEDVAEAALLVLNARASAVIDEINLSPRNRVVRFKPG